MQSEKKKKKMFVITFAFGFCESVTVNKWKIIKIGKNDENKYTKTPLK